MAFPETPRVTDTVLTVMGALPDEMTLAEFSCLFHNSARGKRTERNASLQPTARNAERRAFP
jgi:hypothetical protein